MEKIVFLKLPQGHTTTFQFDICDVIDCRQNDWFLERMIFTCVWTQCYGQAHIPWVPPRFLYPQSFKVREDLDSFYINSLEVMKAINSIRLLPVSGSPSPDSHSRRTPGVSERVVENITFQRDDSPHRNLISVSFKGH